MAEAAVISAPKEGGGGRNKFRSKRRNKDSRFLSNARGFGKKGIYGRGTQIEQESFSYFINISDAIRQGFENLEDKGNISMCYSFKIKLKISASVSVTMANNVFEQTHDQEVHLSSNQVVSKVIENLIAFAEPEHFERFMKAFAENFRPICSDSFASHVLQKMVEVSFLRAEYYKKATNKQDPDDEPVTKRRKEDKLSEEVYNTTNKFSEDHRKNCSEFVLKIGKFLLNNLEDFVWDPCANHIIRTSILVLAGIRKRKVAFERNTQIEKQEKAVEVPNEWSEVVTEYIDRLQMWPQFSEFAYNMLAAQMLAHIMMSLRAVDKSKLKHVGKKILMESFLKVDEEDEKKEKVVIIDDDNDAKTSKNKENMENDVVALPKVFTQTASAR